ncbi:MAG: sigma-54 dependent transcriptional regulator [Sandaracinaceae bacterium]|nr:sigma-54 dependent transcriptional regulator [Sandaracinaceae bacterium]
MSEPGRVLVVDDDASFRFAMKKALRRLGYEVEEAAGGREAVALLTRGEPADAALLDLRMGDLDGLDVLRRSSGTSTRVVVLTGHGSVEAAVEAMKLGAFSFLEKPVDADLLAPLLTQAIAEARGRRGGHADLAPPVVGVSAAMEEVRRFIAQVGPTDATVAVYGETGTGKEVVARRLHLASPRAPGPFVALNAACVPRDLFESELFGHKKGAFHRGDRRSPGPLPRGGLRHALHRRAGGAALESQAKLLRALETRHVRAIGDPREVPVDVRIIAATNRDLWSEVQDGRFREDLYFRLSVFPIVLPPLRDRPEDVVPLAEHLMGRLGGPERALADDAKKALEAHDWPGNVRELLNVLRRASLFATEATIDGPLVRRMLAASVFAQPSVRAAQPPRPLPPASRPSEPLMSLADVERQHIERTLERMGGNITRAATSLGIDRRTLQRKLRSYGISADDS